AHTKLVQLVEEDDSEGGAGGVFRADIDDPDVANALGSSVRPELKMLTRRRHRSLSLFAQNILHSVPSTGPHKLNPQLTSIKPWVLLERELEEAGGYSQVDMKYMEDIEKYLQNSTVDNSLSFSGNGLFTMSDARRFARTEKLNAIGSCTISPVTEILSKEIG
ncbi:hypothetical protein ANCDUO_18667, partial [Ancylostoma duodenale]